MNAEQAARSGRGGRWFISLLMLALLGALLANGVLEARRAQLLPDGELAPAVQLERYAGGTLELEALRGKVVMLDFWASWCPPCMNELPSLVRLAQEYEDKGLVFVAANRDDPDEAREKVSRAVSRRVPDLGRFVVFADDATAMAYRVSGLPTLYFIDRKGRIIDAHAGAASESTLRRWIELALDSPP